VSIRERNRKLTRTRLADAASRLFLHRGYDATTVEDIAREAGVSRRTFFRYFPSKEEVFFADARDRLARFEAIVAERGLVGGAWAAVVGALLDVAGGLTSDAQRELQLQAVIQASDALTAWDLRHDLDWERAIQRVFEASGDPPFRAGVRAGAVMGVVQATLRQWFASGAVDDLVVVGEVALGWLDGAIATDASTGASTEGFSPRGVAATNADVARS
jgi:AcrR family transcriptional regulator